MAIISIVCMRNAIVEGSVNQPRSQHKIFSNRCCFLFPFPVFSSPPSPALALPYLLLPRECDTLMTELSQSEKSERTALHFIHSARKHQRNGAKKHTINNKCFFASMKRFRVRRGKDRGAEDRRGGHVSSHAFSKSFLWHIIAIFHVFTRTHTRRAALAERVFLRLLLTRSVPAALAHSYSFVFARLPLRRFLFR